MNKTKIEWCDYTWNPITGCLNGCFYCYAKKIYDRFKKDFTPQIHYDRLLQPLKCKKPLRIFVCSASDFWGQGMKKVWREEVYNVIKATPEHTYLILTKKPQNMEWDVGYLENVWTGITLTQQKDDWMLPHITAFPRMFVSIEPLLGRVCFPMEWFKWIIIGAMTGQSSENFAPKKEWVEEIIKEARKYKIPLFLKNNLKWKEQIQEFPKLDTEGKFEGSGK